MPIERPPELLDTVLWHRDGGICTGLIWEIRGELASFLTSHGGALVYTHDLKILVAHEEWDPEALDNHLRAVYGIRLRRDGGDSTSAKDKSA